MVSEGVMTTAGFKPPSGLSYHPRGTKAAKWQLWNVFHEFPWSHSMMPQDHSVPLSDSKSIFSPWIPTLIYSNNGERNNESFGVSQWNQTSNCWYGWWLHKPKLYDLVDVTSKTGLLPRNESPQKTTRDEHRFSEIVQTWDERWDLPTVVDVLFVNLEFLWVSEIAQIWQLNSQLILGPSRTFRIPMATQGSCPTSTLRSLEPPRAQRRVKARKNGEWGSYGKFMEIHRQKRKWRRIENLVDMSNWLENVLKILNSELALNHVEKDAVTIKPGNLGPQIYTRLRSRFGLKNWPPKSPKLIGLTLQWQF